MINCKNKVLNGGQVWIVATSIFGNKVNIATALNQANTNVRYFLLSA